MYCLKSPQNLFFLCSPQLIWKKHRNIRWTSLSLRFRKYILSKQQFSSSYNFLERLFFGLKFIMFISLCSHFRKLSAECQVDAYYHIWISHCTLKQMTPCIISICNQASFFFFLHCRIYLSFNILILYTLKRDTECFSILCAITHHSF